MMRPAADSFEAETLAVMRKAHELAWARLLTTRIVASHNLRRMQKLTAQHVIELAMKGERDVWRLARGIIFHACAVAARERLEGGSVS
jgi:hypothetical protein